MTYVCIQFACNTVNNCLQIGYCAVSEVKVETLLFMVEIQQWRDSFTHSERTTPRTAL